MDILASARLLYMPQGQILPYSTCDVSPYYRIFVVRVAMVSDSFNSAPVVEVLRDTIHVDKHFLGGEHRREH